MKKTLFKSAEIITVCHLEIFTKLRTLIHNMLFKMRCIFLLKIIGGTSVDVNVDIRQVVAKMSTIVNKGR